MANVMNDMNEDAFTSTKHQPETPLVDISVVMWDLGLSISRNLSVKQHLFNVKIC